jgi:hypothetical protein
VGSSSGGASSSLRQLSFLGRLYCVPVKEKIERPGLHSGKGLICPF